MKEIDIAEELYTNLLQCNTFWAKSMFVEVVLCLKRNLGASVVLKVRSVAGFWVKLFICFAKMVASLFVSTHLCLKSNSNITTVLWIVVSEE